MNYTLLVACVLGLGLQNSEAAALIPRRLAMPMTARLVPNNTLMFPHLNNIAQSVPATTSINKIGHHQPIDDFNPKLKNPTPSEEHSIPNSLTDSHVPPVNENSSGSIIYNRVMKPVLNNIVVPQEVNDPNLSNAYAGELRSVYESQDEFSSPDSVKHVVPLPVPGRDFSNDGSMARTNLFKNQLGTIENPLQKKSKKTAPTSAQK